MGEAKASIYDQRSEDDFSFRWFSGTGAGGQHRNKHQNTLEITHLPSGLKQVAAGRKRETNITQGMADMLAKLDVASAEEGAQDTNRVRAAQIGSGMRGDKRRTIRFQDDRIADHVTGKSCKASAFMKGDIELLW